MFSLKSQQAGTTPLFSFLGLFFSSFQSIVFVCVQRQLARADCLYSLQRRVRRAGNISWSSLTILTSLFYFEFAGWILK